MVRQFTGRGEVNDDLLLPPDQRIGISGLLFNFDIDDATLKVEHMAWLEVNAVRFLLASRNTRVNLKGLASRSGRRDRNQQLSENRVGAVRDFLIRRGVTSGQ